MLILALSISSRNSLQINPIIAYLIAFIFLLIALYLIYSVLRYFGLKRAYGIDHFDESYRNKKFVKRGIFRFSNNAMYKFGFLFIWIPGLLLLSKPAIIVALFQHIYIWVHFYFTELPDMKNIYSQIK
jgi:protein-S-isoprenylcysteine O-methyltransferase Ste14